MKNEYILKTGDFFYCVSWKRKSKEYPDAESFDSKRAAINMAKRLTSGTSLWSSDCEVYENYGKENERLIGVSENGYFSHFTSPLT